MKLYRLFVSFLLLEKNASYDNKTHFNGFYMIQIYCTILNSVQYKHSHLNT